MNFVMDIYQIKDQKENQKETTKGKTNQQGLQNVYQITPHAA
jgi:hypothetical protein